MYIKWYRIEFTALSEMIKWHFYYKAKYKLNFIVMIAQYGIIQYKKYGKKGDYTSNNKGNKHVACTLENKP